MRECHDQKNEFTRCVCASNSPPETTVEEAPKPTTTATPVIEVAKKEPKAKISEAEVCAILFVCWILEL